MKKYQIIYQLGSNLVACNLWWYGYKQLKANTIK